MGGKRKKTASGNAKSAPGDACLISVDDFKLYLLEALKDPEIKREMKSSFDYDYVTDLVTAKLKPQIDDLKEQIQQRDDIIQNLKKRLDDLETKADDGEQYSRRSSVRFNGILERDNEDPEQLIKSILQDVELDPIIQRCHRVGPLKDDLPRPRPIICQFTGQKDKRAVLGAWKKIKEKHPTVTVNEDLTRIRSKIAYMARKLKRNDKIANTWTADGKVLVKDLQNKIHVVRSLDELSKW